MYGEGAVIERKCQKWCMKFHAGDFLPDDALWSGRPVEVERDQIKTLTENNQCSTMWEIVYVLKISKSIKLLMKIKNMSFKEKSHTDFLTNVIDDQVE